MSSASCLVVTGQRAALLRCLFIGLQVNTILEILLVNTKTGKSKRPPFNDYSISEAHCVLRNTEGQAGAVGVLTVPKELEGVAKPGLYTASFSIEAPTYGENQGKVIAVLKGLVPVPPGAFRGNVAPSAQVAKV
jgi:hypothetical protein